MSEKTHEEHTHHITPVPVLFATFCSLCVLMLLTVWSASWDLGSPVWNNVINLGIAVMKATLVVSIFMGLKYGSSLSKLFGLAGFVWLLLITITFGDYATRSWEPAQGWYSNDNEVAPTLEQSTDHMGLVKKGFGTESDQEQN